MELHPANEFTFEQLTEAYNRTRIDYIVPMPMNVARLREYLHVYDVDLGASCVAVDDEGLLGLAMLGVREDRGWITRVGVLPTGRRQGVGRLLVTYLMEMAQRRGLKTIWLEVIAGNEPAYRLFESFGFVKTRELLVARRPPVPVQPLESGPLETRRVTTLDHEEALILLAHRADRPNWLLATASMHNVRNLTALQVEFAGGGRGWVTYHASLLQVSRIVVEATAGSPEAVAAGVLRVLHQRHATQDAVAENFPASDPKWPGFLRLGYFEAFRRVEMVRHL